jgi:hypothetical protein
MTLEKIYPPWSKICDRYDILHNGLSQKDLKDFHRKEEALVWEQFTFELIICLLLQNNIDFYTDINDVQPIVKTVDKKSVEIDFRIIVEKRSIYFGVTHFYGREKDLQKDIKELNIPLTQLATSEGKFDGGTITSLRDSHDYLNRRMVSRVSTEGNNLFSNDYIYIFIPKVGLGFGEGIDSIPTGFNFSSVSNYTYKQNNISGIVLIGHYIEKNEKKSRINKDKLAVKTLPLNNKSSSTKKFLDLINGCFIDMTNRNEQMRKLLNI